MPGTLTLVVHSYLAPGYILSPEDGCPTPRYFILPLRPLGTTTSRSDLLQIAQFFFLRVCKITLKTSVSSEYFILVGDRSYSTSKAPETAPITSFL